MTARDGREWRESGTDKFREFAIDPAANIVAVGQGVIGETAAFNGYLVAFESGGPWADGDFALVVIVEQIGINFVFILGLFDYHVINKAEQAGSFVKYPFFGGDVGLFALCTDDGGVHILHLEFIGGLAGHGPSGKKIKSGLTIMALRDMHRLHGKIMGIRSILGQVWIVTASGGEKGRQRQVPQRKGDHQGQGNQPDEVSAVEEPL